MGFFMQKLIIWSSVRMSSAMPMYLGQGVLFKSAPPGWHVEHEDPEVPSLVSCHNFSPSFITLDWSVIRYFLIGTVVCFAAHGFAAHGFAAQGFFAAHGFAAQGFFAAHGFAAHGFLRAAQALSAHPSPPAASRNIAARKTVRIILFLCGFIRLSSFRFRDA
jgi:hypothetical protein